ncbi:hypothetical protein FS837_008256 [Tulasnella sp. UAMH 9824]|nr:hypothetical protein FS837_008256 [Tulasnella sp. UAMH 9824]
MSQWNPPSTGGDDWDSQAAPRPAASNDPVPDDWEADDNDTYSRGANADSQRKLWEDANSRAPPPQVVLGSSSTSMSQTQISGAANNTPRMILKRPTGSTPSPSATPSAAPTKTLQEREASYQAARERIFGATSESDSKADGPTPGTGEATIIRAPRGPPAETASPNPPSSADAGTTSAAGPPRAGFVGRVRKQGHGRTVSDLENIGEFVKSTRAPPPS